MTTRLFWIAARSLWIGRLPWNRQTSEGPQEGFDSSGKASNASLRSSCGSVTPSGGEFDELLAEGPTEFRHPGFISASFVSPYHGPGGIECPLNGSKHDWIRPARWRAISLLVALLGM